MILRLGTYLHALIRDPGFARKSDDVVGGIRTGGADADDPVLSDPHKAVPAVVPEA